MDEERVPNQASSSGAAVRDFTFCSLSFVFDELLSLEVSSYDQIVLVIQVPSGFTEKKSNTVASPASQPSRAEVKEAALKVLVSLLAFPFPDCVIHFHHVNPNPQGPEFEAKIAKLVELGFSREAVVQALRLFEGNEEQAAGFLFGG